MISNVNCLIVAVASATIGASIVTMLWDRMMTKANDLIKDQNKTGTMLLSELEKNREQLTENKEIIIKQTNLIKQLRWEARERDALIDRHAIRTYVEETDADRN